MDNKIKKFISDIGNQFLGAGIGMLTFGVMIYIVNMFNLSCEVKTFIILTVTGVVIMGLFGLIVLLDGEKKINKNVKIKFFADKII